MDSGSLRERRRHPDGDRASQWLRIQPAVVLELADKNNPKLPLPSIRGVGNRLLFRRGDVRAWCKKAREFDF